MKNAPVARLIGCQAVEITVEMKEPPHSAAFDASHTDGISNKQIHTDNLDRNDR